MMNSCEVADIFMVIFLLTLYYFTGSMIRIILLFAPVASLLGAYGLVNVLKIFAYQLRNNIFCLI